MNINYKNGIMRMPTILQKTSKYITVWLSTILIMCFALKLNAQDLNFQWVKGIAAVGSGYNIISHSTVTDALGNTYTTGGFLGTVDFDPGAGVYNLTSVGSSDVFIQKLDSNGEFLWAKRLGTSATDVGRSIAVDSEGNVYIVGNAGDGGTIGLSGPYANGTFILKLDIEGNTLWLKTLTGTPSPSTYYSQAESIAIDDYYGDVYITGWFEGTVHFGDPGIGGIPFTRTSYSGKDLFVLKVNTLGSTEWVNTYLSSGSGDNRGHDITVGAGSVYVTGYLESVTDFTPESSSTLRTKNFILKLNTDGVFGWVKSNNLNLPSGVNTKFSINRKGIYGDVYITGMFEGITDFDPGAGVHNLNSSEGRIFVQKLNYEGNFLWAKNMGGDAALASASTDVSGNIYLTGHFFDTIDFDPGPTSYNLYGGSSGGQGSMFLLKLNTDGSFNWAKNINGYVRPSSIFFKSGNILTTGNVMTTTADFDLGDGVYNLYIPPSSTSNMFVYKLNSPCGSSVTELEPVIACDEYIWGDDIYSSSGTYTRTFTTSFGCDSVAILPLTIISAPSPSISITASPGLEVESGTLVHYTAFIESEDYLIRWFVDNSLVVTNVSPNNTFTYIVSAPADTVVAELWAIQSCSGVTDTTSLLSNTLIVTVTTDGTNINDIDTKLDFDIFPNPTSNYIVMKLGNEKSDISIYDIKGRLVHYTENVSGDTKIDFDLPNGTYIVNVESNGKTGSKKIIISK